MSGANDQTYDLGGIRVRRIAAGALRLDGGAMFGIIPKVLWSRAASADEQNRIQLACNSLILEWEDGRVAIVETGHGCKYGEKEQRIYAIDPQRWLLPSLTEVGLDAAAVDDVVLTHLHFDHAGGLTRLGEDGQAVLTFPNARVHVQRQEHDDARASFGIMTATYRDENFAPLDAASAWALHEGPVEMLPGVAALLTRGHTRGHQSLVIRGRDRTAVYTGDVLPTAAHFPAPYNMAYDLLPLDNRESKRRLLQHAADEDWLLFIGHEPVTPVMRVVAEGSWYRLEPVAD